MYQNKNKNIKINQQRRQRAIKIAKYILDTGATVRDAAIKFGVSKSTVHNDVSERLKLIDPELYLKVEEKLNYHKAIRHLRGGEATKMKFRGVINE